MLKEFRDFVMRGNVVDLAIAVIIDGAFGKIITSFVEDVLIAAHRFGARHYLSAIPIKATRCAHCTSNLN